MTPTDAVKIAVLADRIVHLEGQIEDLQRKQRETDAVMNQGRGALWMLLKVGIAISALVGGAWAVWRALWS